MQKLNNIKVSSVPEQQVEIDPRSKTTADKAFNFIAKPEEVKVNGTKRMFTLTSRRQKWQCQMHN
jgi:hypothetical protein